MKQLLSLWLALVLVTGSGAVALAGDGDGGNSGEPITLVNSSLVDGAVIDGDELTAHLEFNKNVVNFSVRENNMRAFALYDAEGNSLPLTVTMGDDQVDPDAKRLVDLSASGLQPGSYRLVISSGLAAKNGTTLDRDIAISFSVAGAPAEAPAPEQPAAAEPAPEGSAPQEPEADEPAGEAAAQGPVAGEPAGQPAAQEPAGAEPAGAEPAGAEPAVDASAAAGRTDGEPAANEPAAEAAAAQPAGAVEEPQAELAAGESAGQQPADATQRGRLSVGTVAVCAAIAAVAAALVRRKAKGA